MNPLELALILGVMLTPIYYALFIIWRKLIRVQTFCALHFPKDFKLIDDDE
jgi:hypothetical protein